MNHKHQRLGQRVGSVTAGIGIFRPRPALRWFAGLIAVFLLLFSTGCAWLDTKQRNALYRPTPGVPADFAGLRAGDEQYFVNLPNSATAIANPATFPDEPQRLALWWLPHADKTAPTLLYFHGTFRNLPQNLHKIEALRSAGFAVLAVDYRGWGLSTSITPSEQTIVQDANLAWAELQRREPRAAQRVIYGHSMGSGVAVEIASRLRAQGDYGGLILESALSSFADVAYEFGFFARFLARFTNERFASIDKIARVQAPLLMIHGSQDTTIPIRVGEKLFAAANPPKQWLSIAGGGHSNLHEADGAQYQAVLLAFKNKYILGQ